MKPLQMGFFHFVIHIKDSSRSFHGLIVHFFFMLIIFHCLHEIQFIYSFTWGFPGGTSGKEPPANAGDMRDFGLIPGSERYLGGGYGNPLQYSCLKNPMDRGAWQAGYSP